MHKGLMVILCSLIINSQLYAIEENAINVDDFATIEVSQNQEQFTAFIRLHNNTSIDYNIKSVNFGCSCVRSKTQPKIIRQYAETVFPIHVEVGKRKGFNRVKGAIVLEDFTVIPFDVSWWNPNSGGYLVDSNYITVNSVHSLKTTSDFHIIGYKDKVNALDFSNVPPYVSIQKVTQDKLNDKLIKVGYKVSIVDEKEIGAISSFEFTVNQNGSFGTSIFANVIHDTKRVISPSSVYIKLKEHSKSKNVQFYVQSRNQPKIISSADIVVSDIKIVGDSNGGYQVDLVISARDANKDSRISGDLKFITSEATTSVPVFIVQ